jgi:4-hydroxy-3-polyprenylbenzoate decarboxylase
MKVLAAKPKIVSAAPHKEIKRMGSEVNLNDLPILKCWPEDGGPFITAGLVFTKSPKTGARNVGIYRLQVFSHNEIGLHWQIQKGGGFHYLEAKN